MTDYFRKPGELGWGPRKLPAHDFLGRDALAADAAGGGPARVLRGLTWNPDDVARVLTSLLSDGEVPDQMDMPRLLGPSFDQILASGTPVGVSTGRTLSPHLRAMISLCVIGRDHAAPGTEVTVVWGRPGTAQREIRATVSALPFKPDHRRTDVRSLCPARAAGAGPWTCTRGRGRSRPWSGTSSTAGTACTRDDAQSAQPWLAPYGGSLQSR